MSKQQAAPDFTGDEYWGIGGRYVVVNGKRQPAPPEPTDPAGDAQAPAVDAPTESAPDLAEKGN